MESLFYGCHISQFFRGCTEIFWGDNWILWLLPSDVDALEKEISGSNLLQVSCGSQKEHLSNNTETYQLQRPRQERSRDVCELQGVCFPRLRILPEEEWDPETWAGDSCCAWTWKSRNSRFSWNSGSCGSDSLLCFFFPSVRSWRRHLSK